MFGAMGYSQAMSILVPTLALLAATLSADSAGRGGDAAGQRATAVRESGGASATVLVSARIIRSAARIGAGFAPPEPGMMPRRTTVGAADGRAVPALIYDFE